MKDSGLREPVFCQLSQPFPRHPIPLATPSQAAEPERLDATPKHPERAVVCRHSVVGEEAGDDELQPASLFWDWQMPAPPQPLPDLPKGRLHSVAPGPPAKQEFTTAIATTDEGEPQEVEGLRLAQPAPSAPCRCKAAKLDQAGLLRMQ
jgi:hypothetical protein